MLRQSSLGLLRHAMTTFGGAFVSKGIVTGDQLEVIVAGIVTLVGVAWSVADKRWRA